MKVLVACEESQEVCKAFRELGHEAYSCDIQECSGGHPEWHIMGDALNVLNPRILYHAILWHDKYGFRDGSIYEDGVTHWMPLHSDPPKGD